MAKKQHPQSRDQKNSNKSRAANKVAIVTGNKAQERAQKRGSSDDTIEVRGRLTKKVYKFKRIKSRDEVVNQLYSVPDMSKTEAYELVKQIRAATAQNDASHEALRRQGIIQPKSGCRVSLPIKCLQANPEIARENLIDWPHVADIAQDIDLDALGNPVVHVRRVVNNDGEFERWEFTILDWTHRYVWAVDEGNNHVECTVRIVDDIAESARVMHKINRNVRRQNVIDAMRNRVVGENPKIMRLIKILGEYEFKPQTSSTRAIVKHGTIGLTKLEKIYDQFGEDIVYRLLDWLSTARYTGWNTQATACSPDVIHGLALLAVAERNGFVHTHLIEAVLTTNSPESVVNQANNELSMRHAEDLYGGLVSGKSEEGRAKRIFCVLLKQVQQRLSAGRLRLKSPHVGTFKTLMNSYYKAKTASVVTRQKLTRKMWNLRQQLYTAKAGDYWFAPDKPAIEARQITR